MENPYQIWVERGMKCLTMSYTIFRTEFLLEWVLIMMVVWFNLRMSISSQKEFDSPLGSQAIQD